MSDTYDHDQQVTDLASTDPATKAAAVGKLNAQVQQVRDANPNSTDIIEYAVVKRTATIEVWVPVSTYVHQRPHPKAGQQMTPDEVREYEQSMTGEDAFQMLVEAASVVDESAINQACTVDFTVGPPSKSDV